MSSRPVSKVPDKPPPPVTKVVSQALDEGSKAVPPSSPARPPSMLSSVAQENSPTPTAPIRQSKKLSHLIGNYEKSASSSYEKVQLLNQSAPAASEQSTAPEQPASPSSLTQSKVSPQQSTASEQPASPSSLAQSKVSLQQSTASTSTQPKASPHPTPSPAQPTSPKTTTSAQPDRVEDRIEPPNGADFGSCLQSARDCINKRHDDELKALESFRVYMHKRSKADAEYAATLGKINSQTAREMAGVGANSFIVQAWNGTLEAMDSIQKKLQSCTQGVDSLLRNIDQLIKDKRGAKRAYDIGRSQLDDEYRKSCNEVQNLRREYVQTLQVTTAAKKKLEQTILKQPVRPAEVDKLRAKFVSSAEKLHKCHNDYTLAILNANTHLDHYHKSTVPFCLNTLQERMELIVSQWRKGMEEYVHIMDMSQVYQESLGKLFTNLQNLNPQEEYAKLIQENKSDSEEDEFTFDTSLLQDYCSPKVEATKMSINNLTYDNLKAELSKMEQRLEEYAKQRAEKEEKLKALNDDAPADAQQNSEVPKAVLISNLQAELKQLDCTLEREKVKAEKVREEVQAIGESPPLFDPLGEGVVTPDPASPTTPLHTGDSLSRGATLDAAETVEGGKKDKAKATKLSSTLKKGFASLFNRKNSNTSHSIDRTEGGPEEQGGEPEEPGKTATDAAPPDTLAIPEDNESETGSVYDVPPETRVEEERWFYPNMERKEAEEKCKNTGDYLIRYSSKQNRYVLTVCWAGQGKHFVIQEAPDEQSKTKYRFESKSFPSVRELLDFHVSSQTPVTKASGAILTRPVLREDDKWALKHEDIKMGRKLGKGAFGDVWEAMLKGQSKVAVKTCRSTDVPDREKFLQEAEILKQYDHPNIVKLIGVSWDMEPVLIVMELMPRGSLLDYLRKKAAQMTKGKMLHMSIDACSGMEYLESKNCIHRDLAARNCLVGESDIVKISDFGMSREEEGGMYTVQSGTRQIPIKWTAPEALNYGRYTSASDVWSFGVLLYEVFSGGSTPYPGMSNAETRTQVDDGYRMPPPQGCPKEVHQVMQQCWTYDADDRTKFGPVLESLKKLDGTIQ